MVRVREYLSNYSGKVKTFLSLRRKLLILNEKRISLAPYRGATRSQKSDEQAGSISGTNSERPG